MHRTTRRFWNCFHELPPPIQKIAQENFALLKENPRHPSLHFKKVGKLWSASYGRPGPGAIIGLLQWRTGQISFGSGLALTTNINE
jgi:hypothetical protein